MFCKKCGGLLVPAVVDGKRVWKCTKCGAIYENEQKIIISESKKTKKEEVRMVEEPKELHYPIAKNITCPKCGHRGVYYWTQQTRAPDEAPTMFFKCPKCGYTWREYG